MLVTIIIPVYNVEKYIFRCVESALNQTYNEIEIILIDDGSTDSSGEKCDELCKRDPRVNVIHKENGGLSSARNVGLDICLGEAVFFLDSDDYISIDCIERLVSLLDYYDSDISISNMKYIPEEMNGELRFDEPEEILIFDSQEAIEESLYQRHFSCCAPAKLYRREILGELRFPIGRVSEDLATCHLFLDNARRIVFSNACLYYYRQRENSIMHEFNPKRMDAIEWAQNIEKFCFNKYPAICDAATCRTFNVAVHLLLELPMDDEKHDKFYQSIMAEIKRTRLNVLLNYKSRGREKVAALLSFFGEKALKLVWNSNITLKKRKIGHEDGFKY